MNNIGTFKCLKETCNEIFEHSWTRGPVEYKSSHASTECPKCGNLYVKLIKVESKKIEN